MSNPERALLIRLQTKGWRVDFITEDCIILHRVWFKKGFKPTLFLFPDGSLRSDAQLKKTLAKIA